LGFPSRPWHLCILARVSAVPHAEHGPDNLVVHQPLGPAKCQRTLPPVAVRKHPAPAGRDTQLYQRFHPSHSWTPVPSSDGHRPICCSFPCGRISHKTRTLVPDTLQALQGLEGKNHQTQLKVRLEAALAVSLARRAKTLFTLRSLICEIGAICGPSS
jgi:hypothetical protein